MSINCPECGIPVEPEAHFCPKCFARIEPPGLWRRFLSRFKSVGKPAGQPRLVNLKKNVTIKTTDETGVKHEYHSLEELPTELRAKLEELEAEALLGNAASARTIISRTKLEVYKKKTRRETSASIIPWTNCRQKSAPPWSRRRKKIPDQTRGIF